MNMDKENQYGNWLRASFPRSPRKKGSGDGDQEAPGKGGNGDQSSEGETGRQLYPLLTYTKEFHRGKGQSDTLFNEKENWGPTAREGKGVEWNGRLEDEGMSKHEGGGHESVLGGQVLEEVKEIAEVGKGGNLLALKAGEVGSVEEGGNVVEGGSGKDKMWVDGEDNHCLHRGRGEMEGEMGGGEDLQEGQGNKTCKGKYRVSKAWKRLVQEVGKRKPLSEVGTVQNGRGMGRRRKGVSGDEPERNLREVESKKKARMMEGDEDVVMLSEVVEPSLNGAPTPQ